MATRNEFSDVIEYISAGCQKSLPASSVEVYYDLLGDIPKSVLMAAAKRVILDHKYATFPTVAMIRELAAWSPVDVAQEARNAEYRRLEELHSNGRKP